MKRDFDVIVDRSDTYCLKQEFGKVFGKPDNLIPLWVADMDFLCPVSVTERLSELCRKGIFGYSAHNESYFEAAKSWFSRRFGWEPQWDWMVHTPGVVFAVNMAVRALTEPGDGVLIQEPVYYPFRKAIENNGRKVVNSPLVLKDGRYEMNFPDMEEKIKSRNVKLFILCSPHNPVGRVWTDEELRTVGEICRRCGVTVVSDEIHCDFTRKGHVHHVFASAGEDFGQFSIICTAPSKTFNLAGLQTSNLWIPNPEIRQKIQDEIRNTGWAGLNLMGLAACEAAYRGGETWLEELKVYLEGNLQFMDTYLKEHVPQVKLIQPEGTYLVWLDCTELGLSGEALDHFMEEKAGLWLDGGSMFGEGGENFQRINIASPRAVIQKAMEQLEKAVKKMA